MNYIYGLLGMAFGATMTIKSDWFLRTFGKSNWAETNLSTSGGTRTMYKLMGIGIIILAILAMTGSLGGIVLSIFGRLFAPPA
jgi:hypothetical protein